MSSPNSAFNRPAETLDRLKIPFVVGGSVASSVHGVPQATKAVDLIAGLEPRNIADLVAEIENEFYVDRDMIVQGLKRGRSFNIIHYATAYKFDIFPPGDGPYHQAQLERRAMETESLTGDEHVEVPLESPGDTLPSKISWFRPGGEVSDQQWNDMRGIVEIQGDRLDRAYLRRWAAHLRVDDLLERVLSQQR